VVSTSIQATATTKRFVVAAWIAALLGPIVPAAIHVQLAHTFWWAPPAWFDLLVMVG
jgi:hypothetical protein